MSRTVWRCLAAAIITATLLVVTPQAAYADSIPDLKWPAVEVDSYTQDVVTSPTGSVTIPCRTESGGSNLTTYDSSGQLVQELDRTETVDGVTNCIDEPIVDGDGTVYGVPYGSSWSYGPNLLAYDGNTLKWKYAMTGCSSRSKHWVVGADGNIYLHVRYSDGSHLIGQAKNRRPPTIRNRFFGAICFRNLLFCFRSSCHEFILQQTFAGHTTASLLDTTPAAWYI